MSRFLCLKLVGTAAIVLALAGCGGGGGGGGNPPQPQPQSTYTVGGAVTGTSDPVTLRLNGANDISVSTGGFTFTAALASGASYTVAIASQPATHSCSISGATGTIGSANVNNVNVACTLKTYTLGGTLSGIVGSVVLRNNGGDNLTLSANGPFAFATAVSHGAGYNVTVGTQPAGQVCTVTSGSAVATANVTNVAVTCTNNTSNARTIGGTLGGLVGTVVLRNNGGNDLSLSSNGTFAFGATVANGTSYNVAVLTQPATQTCAVANGSGTANANVTNVAVTCTNNPSNSRTIGGTVSGLSGTVVLQNNGGDNLTTSTNGTFTFSTVVANGAAYNVTVLVQPAGQTCTVASASGTANANVTNVAVACTTIQGTMRTIGGTVTGLSGTVVLRNNGGNDLSRSANGGFTFTNSITDGGAYNVTVATQPAGQECTVTNGSGTATANVTTVAVTCINVFPRYIGGTISGLVGTIVLRNNGGNDLTMTYNVTFNGAFEFSAPIPHGTTYDVTVFAQPATRDCSVTNGSGTATARVTNIVVTCTSATRTIGGSVTGLAGTVVLRNNQSNSLSLSANGAFTFSAAVAKGSAYNVTVQTHPAGQTCSVAKRSGTANANVTDVAVTCAARTYTLSTRGIKLWMNQNPALWNEYVGVPPDLTRYELWHDVLQQARAAGANDVMFQLSTGVMVNYNDNEYSSTLSYNPTQQALVALAQDARAQGLTVTVSFFSHVQNVISGSGCCNDRPNPAHFPTWFSNHRIRILEAARLARALNARAMIFMSDETQHLLRDPANAPQWVQLVRDVRAEYPGVVISSGWWTPGHGDSITAIPASIIAELDYLGIGLFPDLVRAEEPDVPTLCNAYRQDANGDNVIAHLEDLYTAYGKRIWITDKAFHSFKGAAYDEERVFNPSIPLIPDESMQARLYESFFGVFYTEGPAWLEGVSFQNFNTFRDDVNINIARFVEGPVSESPQHKLAEAVLSDWFNGRRATGC
jgi:sulfur transfer complex TusBCD TusB component (DsrH family)